MLCDEDAIAESFEVTAATNKPGFSCDMIGTNYGDWFGMTSVHFHDDILATHSPPDPGDVVSNVVCQTSGRHNYYF